MTGGNITFSVGKSKAPVLIIGLVILLVVFTVIGIKFWGNYTRLPGDPGDYVENITVTDGGNLLFKEKIMRYPSKIGVVTFEVGKNIRMGFATQPNELNFGLLSQGMSAHKFIELQNNEVYPTKIHVVPYGGVKDFVVLNEKEVVLEPGEKKSVQITMNATEVGEYVGEIDLVIRTPKNPLISFLLPYA
ncbi:MAG: hypothetical protein ABH851_02105 [Methanobacteriota archaeon]